MSTVLLLAALVCFVVVTFGGAIGSLQLIPLGLALWVAALLVGNYFERKG